MSRLVLAVQIPSHVVENVVGIQKHLAVLFYGNGNNISWLRSGNMHITLKFYGDITTSQIQSLVTDLKSKVTVISPFKIEALGLGCFPDIHRPRVIWMGVGGEVDMLCRLNNIAESNAEKLELNTDNRIYRPHFTIGRFRTKYNHNNIEAEELHTAIKNFGYCRLEEWQVDCIVLVKSKLSKLGAKHTPISRISIK